MQVHESLRECMGVFGQTRVHPSTLFGSGLKKEAMYNQNEQFLSVIWLLSLCYALVQEPLLLKLEKPYQIYI